MSKKVFILFLIEIFYIVPQATSSEQINKYKSLEATLEGCEYILERYIQKIFDSDVQLQLQRTIVANQDDLIAKQDKKLNKNSAKKEVYWPLIIIVTFIFGIGIGMYINQGDQYYEY